MKLTCKLQILIALLCWVSFAAAQTATSSYEETSKLIRAPHAVTTLGENLFGDTVNLYNGTLQFVQVDVSLPGNNALPVAVGRRLQAGTRSSGLRPFGKWDLEIPHLHGMFSNKDGWAAAGGNKGARCSAFGAPPAVKGTNNTGVWNPEEFWQGSFLYIPGSGDQQLLKRNPANVLVPGGATASFPVVTAQFWALKCLPTLANDPGGTGGEGFVAVSPEGTSYRFDHMVAYGALQLARVGGTDTASAPGDTALSAQAKGDTDTNALAGKELLQRQEVWLLPTLITDRFGNSVVYSYDSAHPANVISISASDGRAIAIEYDPAPERSNLITSVSDGSRRWTYTYRFSEYWNLDRVILPDGASWSLGDADGLLDDVIFAGSGTSCELPSPLNGITRTGTMVHPSGALASFTLTPTTHGRANVPKLCRNNAKGSTYSAIPRFVYTNSLTQKTISGPGIAAPMHWRTDYGPTNHSWAPCEAGCIQSKVVTVINPDQSVTRYLFGNAYDTSEGKLQRVDEGWDGSAALRSKSVHYRAPGAGPYIATAGYAGFESTGDSDVLARFTPADQTVIRQQGAAFTWQANAFDALLPRPTNVTRSSTLGYARTDQTRYADFFEPFVLGQIALVTNLDTGKPVRETRYDPAFALAVEAREFGLTKISLGYNADGTLAWERDGLGNTTTYLDYRRGMPQAIHYADGSSQSATVNNDGTIATITQDQLHLTTRLDYDPMGRLAAINYPTAPGDQPWTPTTVNLSQVNSDEWGLAAGHWRQDVSTGRARTSSYFDALWRPVFTVTLDTANPGGSQAVLRRAYDYGGRIAFASYPRRDFAPQAGAVQAYQPDLGYGVSTTFDALGRAIATVSDSEIGLLQTNTYFEGNFEKRTRDARGLEKRYRFQAFDTPSEDAVVHISAPENLEVAIERDVFGKPAAITRSDRSNGQIFATRRYVYDDNERLCKTVEPETGATVQQLDAADNLSWRAPGTALTSASCDLGSVAAAAKVAFSYDALHRLLTTSYGDGSAAISRSYWPDGELKTVASSGAVWTMDYNGRRLPTTQSLAFEGQTYTVNTAYNGDGHPVQLRYPATGNGTPGQVLDYAPDGLGRPSTVGPYATAIGYHSNGAIAGFTYGSGKLRSLTQNLRGLPDTAGDTGVLQDAYSYDGNGNVTAIADRINAGPEGASTSRTMGYDGLDRLTTANAAGLWGDASYAYDVLDNLRTSNIGGRGNNYLYGARNLLDTLQSTAAGFSYSYAYDNRGNVIARGNQSYGFDLGNRLSSAANLDTYVYDGFGRRVKTTAVDGTVTISVYSPAGQLLHTARTGGPNPAHTTQTIYLHSHPIAEVKK